MENALLYQVALTMVPHIGPVYGRLLLETLSPEEIFTAKKSQLEKIAGLGSMRANCIKRFANFDRAERELMYIQDHHIQPLFIQEAAYPQRLLNCYDAPLLLYYKGTASLNEKRIIAIVGSRSHSEYGRQCCEELVEGLEGSGVLVVSGLAYGIDGLAHKAALRRQLNTVGVLGHGLDRLYPGEHGSLAREMVLQGGLLSEFMTGTLPDRHHFPGRNRIVAGIADAVIVVETDIKGGSMITAELANGYYKDVFAFPGRVSDPKSQGCNYLIKSNKACLLTNAQQLLETLGWATAPTKPARKLTRELFITLTPEEALILEVLKQQEAADIDEIHLKTALSSSSVAVAILNLEMQNVIQSLPGKMYKIL